MTEMRFVVCRQSLVRRSLLVCSILAIASVGGQAIRFYVDPEFPTSATALFYLDNEASVPTWFQSVLLLSCSGLLFLLGHLHERIGEPTLAWRTMGAVFIALAIDESAAVHESTTGVIGRTFDLGGPFFFGWVVLGIPFVVAFVLAYARFLLRLDGRTRRSFLVAGLLYVSGTIGLEMIAGDYASVHGFDTPLYAMVLVTAEESLEMLGVVVFISSLVAHMEYHFPHFTASVTFWTQDTASAASTRDLRERVHAQAR